LQLCAQEAVQSLLGKLATTSGGSPRGCVEFSASVLKSASSDDPRKDGGWLAAVVPLAAPAAAGATCEAGVGKT